LGYPVLQCKAVYGGPWRWGGVPEPTIFPEGFHKPSVSSGGRARGRWFFATPQACWEVSLLLFLLGAMARGGMSASAVFDVYGSLWASSLAGTQYGSREHFVKKLTLVVLTWGTLRLGRDSGVDVEGVFWHLRPHHEAEDFATLLPHMRGAFDSLARSHACWLFRTLPAVIIDGKWCVQTPVCNERGSGR
jgi:hypothetical protein